MILKKIKSNFCLTRNSDPLLFLSEMDFDQNKETKQINIRNFNDEIPESKIQNSSAVPLTVYIDCRTYLKYYLNESDKQRYIYQIKSNTRSYKA